MALTVSFKGNAYDEFDNLIDCNYQVHYVRQNVWNNVRQTSSNYYSCNAGDDDSLTQDGVLKNGDVILLTFWQGDGAGGATPNNRDNLFDRFAVYSITYDGTNFDNVFNVKLKPKLKPNVSWTLPTTARLNALVTAIDSSNDESVWAFGSKNMFHRHSYYGVTVFPKVGLLTTTYDWGSGFIPDNTHTFTVVNDYVVTIKVVDAWSLQDTNTKNIRIKYNLPVGGITYNPDGVTTKIHTTEAATILAGITDVDSRITSIAHKWTIRNRDNYNTVISDEPVATNTTKNFSYDRTIGVLQRHFGSQIISWNDGWEDLTITYVKELVITNWLPLVNFTLQFLNDTKVRFTPSCSDIDGTVDKYKWDLYSLIPFHSGSYSLAKSDVYNTDSLEDVVFTSSGHYKMVLTATDDYGESASYELEFDVGASSDCSVVNGVMVEDVFFIIPDEYEF